MGIVFILAAIAGAIFVAVAVIHPNQVMPDSGNYIGDFADMSLVDMAKSVQELYLQKIGVMNADGKYYTLGEFLENYHISPETAFGVALPQDVLDVPAFEFFNSDNGVENAMKQIKVSSIPAIVNMFGGKNEDGTSTGIMSEAAIAELANYSMYDLLSDEEKGLPYVFRNVKFADVLQSSFPAADSDNKLMWAVGQSSIGKLLSGMSGESNMLMQLKEGGAFEALGNLSLLEIVGDGDSTLRAVFKDTLTSDLIDENGELNLDTVIDGVSLGELLGCQRNEITDVSAYSPFVTVTEENEQINIILRKNAGDAENPVYAFVKLDNGAYYEAELTCTETEHTHDAECNPADAPCKKEEHTHGAECYEFVWYSTEICQDEHDHFGELQIDGNSYKRTDGLYNVLANTSMSDLTSGSSDALLDKFKKLTIGEILGNDEVKGVMSNFTDLTINEMMNGAVDELFLGSFFNYERIIITDTSDLIVSTTRPLYMKEGETDAYPVYYVRTDSLGNIALSTDQITWYEGQFLCEHENHTYDDHYAACYGFKWYAECKQDHSDGACADDVILNEVPYKQATGLQAKLSSKQIRNLQDLNDEIKSFTLYDVLGEDIPDVLSQIAHTPIGDLNDAINNMYLGGLLNYIREEYVVTLDGNNITLELNGDRYVKTSADIVSFGTNGADGYLLALDEPSGVYALSENGKDWYKAHFVCTNEEHASHSERGCYAYVWYQLCEKTDHSDCEKPVYAIGGKNYHVADGMMAKLAEKKVKEMGSLNETIKTFTLRDVLGNDVPEMLITLADCEIGNLNEEIDKLYIGDVLKNKRKKIEDISAYGNEIADGTVAVRSDSGKYIKTDDGKTWYKAELTCEDEHAHTADCYEYVWYEKCSEQDATIVIDGENYRRTEGITKHIVGIKIGELDSSTLNSAINGMTVGEIITMDENTNQILKSMRHVKIGELGKEINNVYLGSAMNYVRRETDGNGHVNLAVLPGADTSHMSAVMYKTEGGNTSYIKSDDGKTWYEAEFTCHVEDHEHTTDCYEFVWYEKCGTGDTHAPEDVAVIDGSNHHRVTGITKAFVNSQLNNVADTTNHLTIRKLGIDVTENNLLLSLQDVELNNLSGALNETKMGVVLGYTENGGIWLDKNNAEVKGLNAKIASKTIKQLSGGDALTEISQSLTMGDLIDSGMMEITDENAYKFSIIFCGGASEHGNCTLAGYLAQKAVNNSLSAKQYWLNCHKGNPAYDETALTPSEIAHRDAWRDITLKAFINTLLNAIG